MGSEGGVQPFRLALLLLLLGGTSTIFLGKAFTMQILQGETYRARAEENRIVIRRFHPPRGVITDRNGKILVRNAPAFRFYPEDATQNGVVRLLTHAEALYLELHPEEAKGEIAVDAVREYPEGSAFAHIFGYVAEINPEELDDPAYVDYFPGDRLGRLGIEATYEDVVHGVPGRALIEVDAIGETLRVLAQDKATPGKKLQTTIDTPLQRATARIIMDARQAGEIPGGAAAVVMDADSGGIRAMYSFPSFDPNLFVAGTEEDKIESLLHDPEFPLLNRAIAATYPPASTFKIVTGIAGMEEGAIDAGSMIEDTGVLHLGEYEFANWYWVQYGKKDGLLDLRRAIARSNDIFFYRVAQKVEHEALAGYAKILGFGERSGVDLPGELPGLVPTSAWKRKVKGEIWLPGNTLHMGIGQGDLLSTPLQIARLSAVIGNDGTLVTPHLVDAIIDPVSGARENQVYPSRKLDIDPETIRIVRDGMGLACISGGTGWPFFDFPLSVGCKTGTAEYGDPSGRTHAWFTAFVPFDRPEVVVTVLVEKGGDGSSVAGPIVKKILAAYFDITFPEEHAGTPSED